MPTRPVTIVVPVYGDWPSLKKCIDSLKNYVSPKHTVMFINDCGPEADRLEENIEACIEKSTNYIYVRNKKNLGFVGTCNRAVLELDQSNNDILLLNSDTEVTRGFLDELQTVLYVEEKIGAVSPRTNNATICTVPLYAMSQKGLRPAKSYQLFQRYNKKFSRYTLTPTAHGFCMLIRREVIKKHSLFDEIFGRGYGEEVDFCQRIRQDGWSCAISNWSFVFHLEARSFSLELKAKLLEKNNKIIRARYPNYQEEVREYIEEALKREAKVFGKKQQYYSLVKALPQKLKRRVTKKLR